MSAQRQNLPAHFPDLVEAGPKSAEELADRIGANPRALYRLIRAAAAAGSIAEAVPV